MPVIRQLSTSVINKIAAGEVIERPASVVKELLENSLDAGATRIDVVIEKGGTELIRITDNGCGIGADQLHLAVASHATSKINDADDLFRVETLGFRGEALASIAEVSRLVLRSRTPEAESGAEIEIVGGRAEPIRPVGCPVGTSIEIRQLFFNTPVRHKFMKTVQTEQSHITEAVNRLALSHQEVHFSLTHGSRKTHDLPAVDDMRHRVAELFGSELAESLIPIESGKGDIQLSGYVANPTHSRANNKMQYLFLNGRAIRDRSLQHALREAYRGLLLTGRFPICFLHLKLAPQVVDVNVHPTKQEVRFQDSGSVYSQLLGAVRTKFLSTDLVARAEVSDRTTASIHEPSSGEAPLSSASEMETVLFDWAGRHPRSDSVPGNFPTPGDELLQLHSVPPSASQPGSETASPSEAGSAELSHRVDRPQPTPSVPRAIQIHNRYLVIENEEGLEVIDQHALHERILYELLREKVLAGALESQRLLVPEPVDLAASEATAILENRELLAQLGIEVEPFGGETILVSAYPAMLTQFSPAEVLRGLSEKLQTDGSAPGPRDLLDELMHMMACKAAVKFGDSLTPEEVDSLLAQRNLAQDHHHCPHGRPTALVFTREQLDRQFKRI